MKMLKRTLTGRKGMLRLELIDFKMKSSVNSFAYGICVDDGRVHNDKVEIYLNKDNVGKVLNDDNVEWFQ